MIGGQRRPERIGVVVPAKDEAQMITWCLAALAGAVAVAPVPTSVCVVADACTDETVQVVRQLSHRLALDLRVIHTDGGSVGAARRSGMQELIRRLGIGGTWLATTDADSRVPAHWLTRQVHHARAGFAVVAGTVEVVDWDQRSPALRAVARSRYRSDPPRHVHGANLSFWAEDYVGAGGFAAVPFDEDVALVSRLVRARSRVVWADDLAVRTSARRVGRAPEGFAAYLNDLEAGLAGPDQEMA